ncbi:transglycosylase domain-containing protein [Micromonospora echinofusca]|uniref:Penicillin-binding protein n=1 Tax=Micromonospora echinofusca TaxID=47858 RepID=A0ABS3VPF6_MICEH|nr:transglycosylase domain-containing protein [Micromonospora echinofusca]MBO4206376.1 penicillin-binding protein [Micromonospora echinofusca]
MNRALLHRLVTILVAGVVAGVLLAAVALPTALLLGLGFQSFVSPYGELPRQLLHPVSAQRSDLYASDGRTLITSFYTENRTDVPLAAIAPVMRQAIIAAEDIRFHSHNGVDVRGLIRALVANGTGGQTRQGASTLTMQYVRNVLGSDPTLTEEQRAAATEISNGRKIREMRYALALEREIDKDEILRRYLNIAYFGAGAYGIAAASKRYFSKPPAELTLAEAALLAGLVRSPNTDDPINGDADAARDRRGYVLQQMVTLGAITQEMADQAGGEPVTLRTSTDPNDCSAVAPAHRDWGYFCDWFQQWWNAQSAFGTTVEERQRALRRGGYRIVSSLDPGVQATTLQQVLSVYDHTNPRALPTAVVEPGTGRVVAMAVNRQYSLKENPAGQPNRPNTVNPLVAGGGTIEGYQAGSTFKLFTMLAALEAGLPLAKEIDSPSKTTTRWRISGTAASCGGYWCPANADPKWMNGKRTMWTGFGRSVNTYFVKLAEQVGVDRSVEMAERLGIVFRAASDARLAIDGAAEWGPFVLGVSATTPLDLANAYATVAAEGVYCVPLPVRSVTDSSGQPVPGTGPDCRRVLRADVARAATDAARCPVGDQSAYKRCDGGSAPDLFKTLARPVAGKTGTTDGTATEVVVAYTPQLAVASIAANPDDPGEPVKTRVQPKMVDAVARILAAALRDQPKLGFTPPSQAIALGTGAAGDARAGN